MPRTLAMMKLDNSGDGVIHCAENPDDVIAVVRGGNPLDDCWQLPTQFADCRRLVTWSGTLGDDLFGGHPGNWMPAGAAALQKRSEQIMSALAERDIRWCVRPNARHVLSDVPSCRQFGLDHGGQPIDLVLDPVSMLEPMMLGGLDEHVQRMFETLGPTAAMVLVGDAALDAAGENVIAVPPGSGVMPAPIIRTMLSQCVGEETPLVALEQELDAVRSWLDL